MEILPKGCGGTNFENVIKYISENMADDKPASIIILTDGWDDYPPEDIAEGVPVLWMINNTPP